MLFNNDNVGIRLVTSRFAMLDTSCVGTCEIHVEDIASGLANLSIFGFQRSVFFTAAQASIEASVMAERVSGELAREALMVNAPLAYSGTTGTVSLRARVFERFDVQPSAAATEFLARVFSTAERNYFPDYWEQNKGRRAEPFGLWKGAAMSPAFARQAFLDRFDLLFPVGRAKAPCHPVCQHGAST